MNCRLSLCALGLGALVSTAAFPQAQVPPMLPQTPFVPFTFLDGQYTFIGADGSPQLSIGYTSASIEYWQALGGILGSGATLYTRNVTGTGNVNGQYTAQGTGYFCWNNANGVVFCTGDPGGIVTDHITIKPSSTSSPPTLGGSTGVNLTGTSPEANGSLLRTAANSYPSYALNVNGDFQIDQAHEAGTNSIETSGTLVIDGWRMTETQNNIIQGQQIATNVFSAYKYSENLHIITQETIASTDRTEFFTNLMGSDTAFLQWGTANALPITVDMCLEGGSALTYPAVIPVYLNNNNVGSSYRTFIHLVTLAAASTPYCVSIPVPGDTNTSSWAQVYGFVGVQVGIELTDGSNYQASAATWTGSIANTTLTVASGLTGTVAVGQTIGDATQTITPGTKILSQLTGVAGSTGTYLINNSQTVNSEAMAGSVTDAWQTGQYYGTLGSTRLTSLAASANAALWVGAVHIRVGSVDSVYQPLPFNIEFARAQSRYWKTFSPGTAPAQNVGANTGEVQWDAQITTTGVERSPSIFFPHQMVRAPGTVTYYNPSASAATCQDETVPGAGGSPSAVNSTANQLSFTCTGNAGGAVGDLMGVHVTVDSGE